MKRITAFRVRKAVLILFDQLAHVVQTGGLDGCHELGSLHSALGKNFPGKGGVASKDYISLLDKVCGCRSMKDYCEENSIVNDDSIDSVLRFIEIVGTRTSFARTIKNSIERYKKRNGYYPVSDDEIRLIDEVNSFYKNKFGEELSSDVLYFPGDFEKGKVSDVRFQYIQQEMCDYQNSPGIRYASEIYSPCYKSIDIGLDRAMVKGISLG